MDSWIETFAEIAMEAGAELSKDSPAKGLLQVVENHGRAEVYNFVLDLANEFERDNKGRNWDGEFYDEINAFVAEKFSHQKTFFRLYDRQTGRYMATGYNTESAEELAKEYRSYLGDLDHEDRKLLKAMSTEEVFSMITTNDFIIERSETPFLEEDADY